MKGLLPALVLGLALSAGGLAAHAAAPATRAALSSDAASRPLPRPIPFKQPQSEDDAAGRTILALTALLGLAWGGLLLAKRKLPQWPLARRLGLSQDGRRLKLVETMRLGPRASLYLVQLDQKTLLLAQSGDQITVAVPDAGPGATGKKEDDLANHP